MMVVTLQILAMPAVSVGGTQVDPSSIVLPYEWVGNIDEARFNEPSGICWHSKRETLFVVGDNGDVCEMRSNGVLIRSKRVREADFEGITHDPSTGLLYVAVEGADSVIELHQETLEVLREFSIPRVFDGRMVLKEGGQGIEGITFVPDSKHPQGGVFYITN